VADVSDEMLMAYADGALDPADRAIVEEALKDRPDYPLLHRPADADLHQIGGAHEIDVVCYALSTRAQSASEITSVRARWRALTILSRSFFSRFRSARHLASWACACSHQAAICA